MPVSRRTRLNVFKPAPRTGQVGRECELTVERLADEGEGLAHWEGKRVFIAGALPGERVRVRIRSEDRHGLSARLLDVLGDISGQRTEPPCVYFGRCGGCQWQHFEYRAQLRHKQMVAERRLGRLVVPELWLPPVAADPLHYRHRTRLQVDVSRDGVVRLGFRQQGSHVLVDIVQCLQLQEPLNRVLNEVREVLTTLEHPSRVKDVQAAVGEGGAIAVQWHVGRGFTNADGAALVEASTARGWLAAVVAGPDKTLTQTPHAQRLPYPGGSRLLFAPGDFTQANPVINTQMVRDVKAWLAPTAEDHVTEFFSGLGNFSFALAESGCRLTGYELEAGMVARANERAGELGFKSVRFRAADLYDQRCLGELAPALESCGSILLDPPRSGARALCQTLGVAVAAGRNPASRIVYVSCNSLALAGDLEPLLAAGFVVTKARMYDMFPQTHHFETVLMLERG